MKKELKRVNERLRVLEDMEKRTINKFAKEVEKIKLDQLKRVEANSMVRNNDLEVRLLYIINFTIFTFKLEVCYIKKD